MNKSIKWSCLVNWRLKMYILQFCSTLEYFRKTYYCYLITINHIRIQNLSFNLNIKENIWNYKD